MSDKPWYHNGLRFSCTSCGNCCSGASGYVWVNQAEIEAIAQALEMSVEEFEASHVRRVGIRKSLAELSESNWDCVLLDPETRKCTVYDFRPRQCRTWPFWQSNLRNEAAWAETCEVCPGSGKGELYTIDEIESQVSVFRV